MTNTTGLPVLSDGYFWRLSPYGNSSLKVELRQNSLFGSKILRESVVYDLTRVGGLGVNEVTIVNTAERILADIARTTPNARIVDRFVGDYPPKSL